ncbi:MAG: hypothetical protein N2380_07960 [bacterium]|nr:hypothetical protein [bacterium]
MRKFKSLNGIWEVSLDKRFSPTQTYSIEVPNCIGNQVPALRDYRGVVWYRRDFEIDKDRESKYLLSFGAVNYYAEVWLNDILVGSHEGGYTPFTFDVTHLIKPQNILLVKVIIPGEADPNYPFSEIPHGKQEPQWYGMAGGIWQEVRLIQTGVSYIKNVKITPNVDESKVYLLVNSEKEKENLYTLHISLIDPKGKEINSIETELEEENSIELTIKNPILWDVDNPNLYTVRASIHYKSKILDEIEETFGIRKVEVKDEDVFLNGKPIYLMGALDQDFYPFTHYNPPSEEFVRDELILAKEMGLNCLRYHIKVPHPWYLKWADRLGVLVWYDMPNWSRSTSNSKARGEKLLEEMVEYDYNHPSVIIRSIINENWGLDLVNSKEDRDWLKKTYNWLKKKDPTRIVVDNSACFPNFHIKTDIEDFHNYFAFPDKFREMQRWTEDFSKHPSWTFAQDGERQGYEPLIVSEFGNWGLPNVTKLRAQYGGDPWWFQQRDTTTATKPLGVEERFWQYGLDKVFDNIENLTETFQELQYQALRFQIEEIRKYPQIKGYIITEFTDLYWECNGLLDLMRGKKSYFDELKNLNTLDLVFPQKRPTGVWSGDKITIPILFSHLSHNSFDEVKISWNVEGTEIRGSFSVPRVSFGLNEMGNIEFIAPDVSESKTFRLVLKATSRNRLINENIMQIFVVPRTLINTKISVLDNSLEKSLRSAGINICNISEAEVVYATSFSDDLEKLAKEGKTVILELSGDTRFSKFGYVLERRKGITEARWVGGLGIFNPKIAGRVFREKVMDYRFIDDAPINYLHGEFNFGSRTLAGMIIGWIYYPLNFMIDVQLGEGNMIVHTFPMIDRLSNSPVMKALLGQILDRR